jgi:Flp pilus assembly protein TadG
MLRAISRSVGAAGAKRTQLARDRRGVSAIEFAICAPVIVAMGTGMLKFGLVMSHYLMLTNASAQGVTTLALARGTTNSYAATITAVTNAAPSLTAASITKTVRVNGTTCTTNETCAPLLAAGVTARVDTSYPCDLSVMGVNFKPSCTLSTHSSQMVQ